MKKQKKFYPDLYVIAKILLSLADGRSKREAALLSGVNYNRFLQYVEYLRERGLVAGEEELRLTPKGAEAAARLAELIKELTGEEPMDVKRK
ncbi:conserved within P. aerophilum [Pyrobaculum aerophilum str. IM2]|uniref:Conserved within P. aerophilum n=2 Tax=Pyrobaculum aerophilum TaxID=13773 RepID=Q8ZTZ7_PYRAE|nr:MULTISPECIES: winged helix-turn-helix domain-containing protein [Pyrobaculum]AAL64612.1 conserved within P. aerophilum [Pyrobaculum aerophilum str. IM2]HII46131.1 transcriptional regulator [Pyrobaculum aerophilum]